MTARSAWLAAAWSMTRWQSSGQSCISPSMAFPLWFLPLRLGYRRVAAVQPENQPLAALPRGGRYVGHGEVDAAGGRFGPPGRLRLGSAGAEMCICNTG